MRREANLLLSWKGELFLEISLPEGSSLDIEKLQDEIRFWLGVACPDAGHLGGTWQPSEDRGSCSEDIHDTIRMRGGQSCERPVYKL